MVFKSFLVFTADKDILMLLNELVVRRVPQRMLPKTETLVIPEKETPEEKAAKPIWEGDEAMMAKLTGLR